MEVVVERFYVVRGEGEEEKEIYLEIHGSAEPYEPGIRSGRPDNWTPDEGGTSSVVSVFLNGDLWDDELTSDEEQDARAALLEQLDKDIKSAQESEAADRYESMMDDLKYWDRT